MSYVPVIVRRKSLKIVPTSLARLTIKTPETDLIYWISISSFLLGDGMCALVVELTWVCPVRWCDVGDYQSLLVTSWPWTPNIKRANRLSQAHSMRIVGFLLWRRSHEGKPCWAHFFVASNTDSGFLGIPYSRLWSLFSEITCWTSPEGRSWVQKAPCSTCQGRQGKEEGKKTIIPLQIC